MFNPKTADIIIPYDGYELPERPTLTKAQLKEWVQLIIDNPEYMERIEALVELVTSIHEKVEKEEQEKIKKEIIALEKEIVLENIQTKKVELHQPSLF